MSKVQQLIAKALSTNSEEEAIACLRIARKQSDKTFTAQQPQPQPQQQQSAKGSFREIHLEQQLTILNRMYTDTVGRAGYFMDQVNRVNTENSKLRKQNLSLENSLFTFKALTLCLTVGLGILAMVIV